MYLIWLYHPSFSVARLPVDEPDVAWIMTHDHDVRLRARSADNIGAIEVLLIDWLNSAQCRGLYVACQLKVSSPVYY